MKAFAIALVVASVSAVPLRAQQTASLQQRIEGQLRQASPGTRFGLVVATREGQELIAIAPDQRFIPASNTKIFTTAAAFVALPAIDRPDTSGGARVRLERDRGGLLDVVLEGRGDARLSSALECVVNCLSALADAVAARTRRVDDVIGDDRWFPDERWSLGMSWNNIHTRSGTAISALTVDDNELKLRVLPTVPGTSPRVELPPYFTVENGAVTVKAGESDLVFDRLPGSRVIRLAGTVVVGDTDESLNLGIDDPAHYAAWRLKALLEERGIKVRGEIKTRHRPPVPTDQDRGEDKVLPWRPPETTPLARLIPPPLVDDLTIINKESHNVHAELMLRRVGRTKGDGSVADGVAAVEAMLNSAGVPRTLFDFSDGSGMSTYNRVAPRATVMLLRWIGAQPWAQAWRKTLPIAGVDGTLDERFKGTWLQGRLFAKTGTLNATNALSGYMTARSGRTLLFAAYANDVPGGGSARAAIDSALVAIAAEN
ncbi:D-alanyl-D-alanine carboxypeptidase/D-alanyl-D-alanine-endopeptidase [Sphingomonas sp.]|uniref:D-alanyl-D-alanine carboxypeptidase/D-alanyl-D-alanine endopeptidase n=1 Tax=Sphingomonas sp. TaxID=28214 RepID=UPI00182AAA95|nr:D-alanyl-D-alanine carboxypeptidase/D-alanyl-D-alanine-endopeptidase [Sphingomonas sp.]MBA3511208.1 D-alanyl-D-alanine carboxypeptidase/D-alanyl-D-alanine-endopeptidase [Sphingomonas sp.]